jgi:large subunit ribosomal protein L13
VLRGRAPGLWLSCSDEPLCKVEFLQEIERFEVEACREARREVVMTRKNTTYVPQASEVKSNWYLLDAEDQVLGRLATYVAVLLMGKHKPDYTPFLKTGDHVVVVNAEKVRLTGKKEDQKMYRRHSGYPGGLKSVSARRQREVFPERMIEGAVAGMLPKNKLGKQLTTRLKVYAGAVHPHEAQQPEAVEIS